MKSISTLFFTFLACTLFSQVSIRTTSNNPVNNLAIEIYKNVVSENKNFMFSPLSIYGALSMVAEGSAGTTKTYLSQLLGLREDADTPGEAVAFLQTQNEGNALKLFNSTWYNSKFNLNEGYFDILKKNYHADIFKYSDNTIPQTNQQANEWVRSRTNDKIKELAVPINPETMVAILNVAYFLAEWDIEFDKKDTKERTFHSIKSDKQKADFMYKRGLLNYFEDDQKQAVKLPYKGDAYSMLLIVPKSRKGLIEVEKNIDDVQIAKINSSLKYADVKLYLPKFRMESQTFLNKAEAIRKIFNSGADFSLIDPRKRNIGGDIVHKTFIEIDERKTEAAALTEVILIGYGGVKRNPPPPKIVDADHPFLFLIMDDKTNSIAFMGRYVDVGL